MAAEPKANRDNRDVREAVTIAGMEHQPVGRLRDLRIDEWWQIGVGATKSALDNHVPLLASALAYSTFFAIPSLLLVVVGIFTLTASPAGIDSLLSTLQGAVPAQALDLFNSSLKQINSRAHTSVLLIVVGTILAFWSLTGAMSAFMTAISAAYGVRDRRSFFRRRWIAFKLVLCFVLALVVVGGLLVFGPTLSGWLGRATGHESLVNWIWWAAQWPLLIGALLGIITVMLWLAPVQRPSWRLLLPGALLATAIWIVSSAGFALFTATFDNYNKTWGSLSAVIVTLVWLWLTSLALLLGAELNAEAARVTSAQAGARRKCDNDEGEERDDAEADPDD
jgi:membrane protein